MTPAELDEAVAAYPAPPGVRLTAERHVVKDAECEPVYTAWGVHIEIVDGPEARLHTHRAADPLEVVPASAVATLIRHALARV